MPLDPDSRPPAPWIYTPLPTLPGGLSTEDAQLWHDLLDPAPTYTYRDLDLYREPELEPEPEPEPEEPDPDPEPEEPDPDPEPEPAAEPPTSPGPAAPAAPEPAPPQSPPSPPSGARADEQAPPPEPPESATPEPVGLQTIYAPLPPLARPGRLGKGPRSPVSYALGAVGPPTLPRRETAPKPDVDDSGMPPYDKRRPGESKIPSERAKQRQAEKEFEDLMKRNVPRRAAPRTRIPFPRRPGGGPTIGGSVILIPEILKEAVKVITRKPPEPGIRPLPRGAAPPPPAPPRVPPTHPERPEPVPDVRPPPMTVPRPLPEPPPPPVPEAVDFPTPTPSVPSGLPAPSTGKAPAPIAPLPAALIPLAGLELLLRDRTARDRSQNVTLPGDVVVGQPQPMPEPAAEPAPSGAPAISPLPAPAPKGQPERLTPSTALPVCFPDPDACRKAKQKRKQERDAKCKAFIKVPVRAHKKSVCVQDLAKYLFRKFKSKAVRQVKAELKKHGIEMVKRPRRPKLPDIELGGGVEIDIGDLIKGK